VVSSKSCDIRLLAQSLGEAGGAARLPARRRGIAMHSYPHIGTRIARTVDAIMAAGEPMAERCSQFQRRDQQPIPSHRGIWILYARDVTFALGE
jgi:hypothetical protein